jgi:hypothetical protein
MGRAAREVLEAAGRPDDAAEAFEQSLVGFEEKESLAGAVRVRQRLGVLRTAQISGGGHGECGVDRLEARVINSEAGALSGMARGGEESCPGPSRQTVGFYFS